MRFFRRTLLHQSGHLCRVMRFIFRRVRTLCPMGRTAQDGFERFYGDLIHHFVVPLPQRGRLLRASVPRHLSAWVNMQFFRYNYLFAMQEVHCTCKRRRGRRPLQMTPEPAAAASHRPTFLRRDVKPRPTFLRRDVKPRPTVNIFFHKIPFPVLCDATIIAFPPISFEKRFAFGAVL